MSSTIDFLTNEVFLFQKHVHCNHANRAKCFNVLVSEKLDMLSVSEDSSKDSDLYADVYADLTSKEKSSKIRLYKVLGSYFEKHPDQHILLCVDVGRVFECDLHSLMVCTLANDMDTFKNLHIVFNNVPNKYIQKKGMPCTRRDIVVIKA